MPDRGPDNSSHAENPIVFYDGTCALCHRSVRWLFERDSAGLLLFAPIEGETARELAIEPGPDPAGWSFLLELDGRVYHRSNAVLRAIALTGGVRKLARILLIVPRPVRDGVYRWVARNRYDWFGRSSGCPIPDEEQQDRLLP